MNATTFSTTESLVINRVIGVIDDYEKKNATFLSDGEIVTQIWEEMSRLHYEGIPVCVEMFSDIKEAVFEHCHSKRGFIFVVFLEPSCSFFGKN